MGEIVISIILALGLLFGAHKLAGNQEQGPPPNCTGAGCGTGAEAVEAGSDA